MVRNWGLMFFCIERGEMLRQILGSLFLLGVATVKGLDENCICINDTQMECVRGFIPRCVEGDTYSIETNICKSTIPIQSDNRCPDQYIVREGFCVKEYAPVDRVCPEGTTRQVSADGNEKCVYYINEDCSCLNGFGSDGCATPSEPSIPSEPCENPFCLFPGKLGEDKRCHTVKPYGPYPKCNRTGHTYFPDRQMCGDWQLENEIPTGQICSEGYERVSIPPGSVCVKFYTPEWLDCEEGYKPTQDASQGKVSALVCEKVEYPKCQCPSIGNYTGCMEGDHYDLEGSICYDWYEPDSTTTRMPVCNPPYIQVVNNGKLYCVKKYDTIELPCPPGFEILDGRCEQTKGERCSNHTIYDTPRETPRPTETSTPTHTVKPEEPSQTPKPEEPSQTPRPEEPSQTSKPEEPSQTPKPEEPSQTSKPEEASQTPKPEEPSQTPKPEEPSQTPKPEEASQTPKPEEASQTPKPEEPSQTPKPEEASQTPKPEEPSQTSKPEEPSQTPKPEEASQTSRPMQEPRPSQTSRPAEPSRSSQTSRPEKPSFSSRPSMKIEASKAPIRDRIVGSTEVEKTPLPSMRAVASPIKQFAKSPLPSPWYKKEEIQVEQGNSSIETPRPVAYVETKIILPGADAETVVQGEKIQEIQASLACALRMPVEKIRIRKFYKVGSDGGKEVLPVNPEDFYIVGDGSEGCYTVNSTGARRLQAAGQGGSVEVEYVIVEPPQEIVELSTAQLTAVLATSDAMVSTVQSVGSTGIEAAAITVPVAAATTGVQTADNDFTTVLKTVVGPAIGGGVGGLILIAVGVVVGIKMYRKRNQKLPLTQKGIEVNREGQHLHKNPLVQLYDSTRALGVTGHAYAGRGPVNRASQDITRVAMEPTHVGHAV